MSMIKENSFQITSSDEGQMSLFSDDWFAPVDPISEDKKDNASDSCGAVIPTPKAPTSKKKKAASEVVPKKETAPKLESVKLGEGWIVHYSANSFRVDFLFLEESRNNIESVTLEEIRLKLVTEEDAAELTASGTKWRYDEELKHLYPDAWGQDKGWC